ncbi:DEAD/DEAH box helicase [Gordonibacter sp. Marseille-P4307]|uniref:DEAD/DEAH box helicase n=1 Tax=Gordonibacter sp. Marseille-P4307 TaxID=2161815 RepID=UPI000F525DBF|nr:DEAD/DEAH box helicase [Gordonibacter sp. Marseille-P4307]
MKSFSELGLSAETLAAVEDMGYTEPTPVQQQAIPLILEGRDVIAAAKTGTGKTGGFSLPALDRLGHAKKGSGPLMLVITPTRELAQQIGEVCEAIVRHTRHRTAIVVGGLSYAPQIERIKSGCDVLIATPGRLIDLLDQRAVSLKGVETLVLDEADRMLDMGFLPAVKKIVAATPKNRQTLLFSATIDRSIMSTVNTMLHDPALVEIAHKGDVADTIDQFIIRTPQTVKPSLVKAVLEEKGAERVIIFARTRSRADSTARRLKRAGYSVEAIHSDRSQNQRKRALDRFSSGEVNILTATDVLARGIDVTEVDYVINYDLPTQPEDYVHRIGRTGRAGAAGFSISFVTPETEDALKDIQKLIKQDIPEMKLASFDFSAAEADAAAKQMEFQAKRDPEIAAAKKELRAKTQRKAHKREAEAATTAIKRHNGRKKGSSGSRPTSSALDKRSQSRTKNRGGNQSAPTRGRSGSGGDFRPGRAHRADLERKRSRS